MDVHIDTRALKALEGAPLQVRQKYTVWLAIITHEGLKGIRLVRGFRDEPLKGEWKGHRASRLSDQWRLIYRIEGGAAYVERVTPHDYRR